MKKRLKEIFKVLVDILKLAITIILIFALMGLWFLSFTIWYCFRWSIYGMAGFVGVLICTFLLWKICVF